MSWNTLDGGAAESREKVILSGFSSALPAAPRLAASTSASSSGASAASRAADAIKLFFVSLDERRAPPTSGRKEGAKEGAVEGRSDEEEEGEETSPTNADASTSSLADDFRFRPASFKHEQPGPV